MTTPDFSKIWGTNGNVTYQFSDDNYLKGWQFIGNVPPARGMFDAYFNGTDKKLKYLFDTSTSDLSDNNAFHAESTGYGIVSGCTLSVSGLTATVSSGVVHTSTGKRVEISQQTVSLNSADASNPRIDVIYIDTDGNVGYLSGSTTSTTAPDLKAGWIKLGEITIAAGATTGTITADYNHYKNPSIVFDNVKTMRQDRTLIPQMVARTLGYYTPNDNGKAMYIIRSKTDSDINDGGSIVILDNGNVAELLINAAVNVKQFGATGDGTKDDTTAFKNALASAKNKSFIVPTGTYAINENLFADDVNEVIDAGTYTNIKPVYPRRDMQLTATDNIELVSNVVLGDEGFEGFCYNSTLNQFICAGKKTDDSKQTLYVLNPDDFSVIKSRKYTELAHANTLTYNPDDHKIYCLYDSNAIAVINEETLDIERTFKQNDGLTGLAYDPVTKLYAGFGYWGNNDNGYFYIYDASFELLRKIKYDTQLTTNGLCMHDGKIIALFLGQIQEFDILTGLVKTLKYDDKVELEDVCTKDGELFFNSNRLGSGICTFFALGKSSSEEQILRKNTEIVADVDLNNIKIDGAYKIILSDADSWETYHFPESAINFHLIVNSINKREHIIQEAYRISQPGKNHIFYRIYEDDEWTPWFSKPKFIDSSHSYNIGTWYGSGFITGNKEKVYVTIPCVAHFPAKINSLSITGELTIRQNNNYIVTTIDISSATVTYSGVGLINLEIPITAQDIIINNSSCGIELRNMVLSVS